MSGECGLGEVEKQLCHCHGNGDPEHVSPMIIRLGTQFVRGCRRRTLSGEEGGRSREGGRIKKESGRKEERKTFSDEV